MMGDLVGVTADDRIDSALWNFGQEAHELVRFVADSQWVVRLAHRVCTGGSPNLTKHADMGHENDNLSTLRP